MSRFERERQRLDEIRARLFDATQQSFLHLQRACDAAIEAARQVYSTGEEGPTPAAAQ